MIIKVKRLHSDAVIPHYDLPGDAGMAMHSLEDKILMPGERYKFKCGWALEFDPGHVAVVMDRGSMGVVKGLKTMGGVFDANYRGEYNVCLVNLSDAPYQVQKGDNIAQLVLLPFVTGAFVESDSLSETSRGASSFGSTGR